MVQGAMVEMVIVFTPHYTPAFRERNKYFRFILFILRMVSVAWCNMAHGVTCRMV